MSGKLPHRSIVVAAICLALAIVTWLVFGQTLEQGFINYDDPDYVLKNAQVSRGLTMEGIVWAFTHVHAANWHPLTWISHMIDCQLYGLNPRGHHLTNVILHTATAILLFLVLRQMTGALWRSAFVAAVFAIHPLRVESVAWIAERKDVLSGLFFILTLAAYLRYVRRRQTRSEYALVAVVFALGLMAKPMLVSVPIVLLLLDYWPLNRLPSLVPRRDEDWKCLRRLVVEKLPLLALGVASCAITVFAQRSALRPVTQISLAARTANAAIAYVDYLRQIFWPNDLAVFYPWDPTRLQPVYVVMAIVLLAAISLGVYLGRHRPYLVTGWLWYLVMLLPVIGIVQVGLQAHADRYTYLPQIGLYLMLSWSATELSRRWNYLRPVLGASAAAIIVALVFAGRAQAAYWRDSETLWTHALASTKDNIVAEANLGQALHEKGRNDEAVFHFEKSLEINRQQPTVLSSLGVSYLELGRIQDSLAHLQEAVEMEPKLGDAHYNLGNTYLAAGNARDALEQYQRALEIEPDDIEALNNAAWILATWPDPDIRDGFKAVVMAERANLLTRNGNNIVCATLAAAYAESGRFDEARKMAERAIRLANNENNASRAESIRAQRARYQQNQAYHERR